ncbi:hypothetical protein TcarDRAFT_0748 [Thermosinus carboxydivorans Nor1]|uniref:Flagellar protein FliT n=1 Tax=Thermosinus carboxydivorans Nor1 TaxID=401526 RepID=A1HT17_9FIRM|nr:hypothetical protein [Thermosinus carboxydivorans]EAX46784.1 hypothetical protein TcarDRAFT_0748 [Thermosinus carboxydivorans Nor1]
MDEAVRSGRQLWQDYLFLTREMGKCLARNDFDLFTELLGQRQRLQELIEAAGDQEFTRSAAGRQLFAAIQAENAAITRQLQLFLNRAKTAQAATRAYERFTATAVVGRQMDRQT